MDNISSKQISDNNCQSLLTFLKAELDPFLETLRTALENTEAPLPLHLNINQYALLAAYFRSRGQTKVVIVDGSPAACRAVHEEISAWSNLLNVDELWHLIDAPLTIQEQAGHAASSLSTTYHHFMASLRQPSKNHFIIPLDVAEGFIPSPTRFKDQEIAVTSGEPFTQSAFIEQCIKRGYTRFTNSLEAGGIQIRGEQIDIAHPVWRGHYTLAWYGSRMEHIVYHHERRSQTLTSLTIPPLIFPEEAEPFAQALQNMLVLRPQHVAVNGAQTIILSAMKPAFIFPFLPTTFVPETLQKNSGWVFAESQDRVTQYLQDHDLENFELCPSPLARSRVSLAVHDTVFVSEAALLPTTRSVNLAPISRNEAQELLSALTVGRPAVHDDHGIGIFEGLQTRTIDTVTREYLMLRYAAGDTISVPVEYAHKITPYIGETHPPLHRLGGTAWSTAKRAARHDAERFAQELLEIARQRSQTHRPPFTIEQTHEEYLDRTFAYDLTPDQFAAWHDVQEDLQSELPADRLVVGDVGFGKTEIALRAAYHVAREGRQVAVLAPTTLLVQQHTDTFRARWGKQSAEIGSLSRFATPREQKIVREKIARGELRVIIGTHALLSKDTTWKDLGLVIIDEEQRFGVGHKEQFKKLRASIDLLSLSATPIPRTLSMALTGLKQLSVITTPPTGRLSVETIISRDNDVVLKKALQHELAHGGQVYVVSPKIRGLGTLAHRVRQAVPKARVAIAHGQLPARELAEIMEAFDTGKLDVLVSSTIIEHGIDLPRANTIIITRATQLGLADLYQLRGRVGRRERQGYAYCLYSQTELTSIQKKRLAALTEASRLGSGWLLAQHDLELRGAGNLLGADQSGTVTAVGVQLYLDLVREASHDTDTRSRHDIDIQLPLTALLPDHYIADAETRLQLYHQLTRASTLADLMAAIQGIENRFGHPPEEVRNLYLLIRLQHAALRLGITAISAKEITPPDEDPYMRLRLSASKPVSVLQKLGSLGGFEVKGHTLSLNIDALTPEILESIIQKSMV